MGASHQRISQELQDVINFVRAKCILHGKKPPSIRVITKKIAKNVDKEKLWENEFIRL